MNTFLGERKPAPIGKRFGRLIVLSEAKPTKDRRGYDVRRIICKCECGKETNVLLASVINHITKSCGCLIGETTVKRLTKHGRTKTKEHRVWQHMRARCHNVSDAAYHLYGARGIKVCKRWRESFDNFFEDMGVCPEGRSLDRIDNDRGYSPENCRWATVSQQANNKRTTIWIEAFGIKDTTKGWSQRMGIPPHILRKRLKRGWSEEDTVTVPIRKIPKE